jgi:hypothetical protein
MFFIMISRMLPPLMPSSSSAQRIRTMALPLVCLSVLGVEVLAERSPEDILNLDFNGTDSGQLSPTFAGRSPLGGGVFWNGVNANANAASGSRVWSWIGLVYSDGQTESDLEISAREFTGVMTLLHEEDGFTPGGLHNNALLVDVMSTLSDSGVSGELSISGLKPQTSYDLVLYGRGVGVGTSFTVEGLPLQTSGIGAGEFPLEESRDYVRFDSIGSGDIGEITILLSGPWGALLAGLTIATSQVAQAQ